MYTSFFSDPCVITYMYVFMFECSLRRQRPSLVFVTRRGDEEKMRTNIDQTNVMLTPSIALLILCRGIELKVSKAYLVICRSKKFLFERHSD